MGHSEIKVLLVEDNPGDARLIQELLKEADGSKFEFAHVSRLMEMETRLQSFHADVLLLDLGLPESQGLETLKKAKAVGPHLPIVILTGLFGDELGVEAVANGAQDYLVKGRVDGALLRRAVQYAIERKRAEAILQEREQQLSSIYDTVGDVIFHLAVEKDGRYRFISVNQAFVSTTGIASGQVVGKRVDEVIPEPSLTMVLEKYKEAIRDKKIVRWEETSEYPTGKLTGEVNVAPVFDATGNCTHLVGAMHDITDRMHAEQQRNLAHAIAVGLAGAGNAKDTIASILEMVCTTLSWAEGELWIVDPQLNVLRCDEIWFDPTHTLAEFTRVTREITFAPGIGLPGRIWASTQPHWIPDVLEDRNFPRSLAAAKNSLHSGFGFPILSERQVIGVACFFSKEIRQPNTDLLQMFNTIGSQIGQFMHRKHTEEALRESENRYRSLFENMLEGYAYCKMLFENDKPQDFIYMNVNSAFEKLTGLKNVVGKKVSEVIPGIKESNPELIEIYGRVALTGKPERLETYLESLGIWFSVAVYSPGKEYFVAVFDNITERKRSEEALRESEERFRLVVESAPNAIVMVDQHGKIALVNSKVEEYFGYTRNELIGQPIELLIPQRYRSKHRNHVTMHMTEPAPRQMAGRELSAQRKDGTEFPVEIGLNPVATKEGTMVLCSVVDITERKQAEEQLRKLSHAVEQSPASIVITDPSGRIEYVNPKFEHITGYSAEEVLGKNSRMLKSGYTPPEEYGRLWEAITSGSEWRGEFHNKRKDGELFWEFASISPVRNVDGTITHFVAVKEDITERKRAEDEIQKLNEELEKRVIERTAQLEAANKELESFSYSVSHDLRAPLRHIDGFIDLLNKEISAKLDERSKHYLTTISDAAERMGSLIDDLLSFSRMGPVEMLTAPVNIERLVKEAIQQLSHETEGRQISWNVSELPVVEADLSMLRLVLVNLLSNAIKFTRTRTHAQIDIGCTNGQPDEVVFFVRDNGVGFDTKYADKLFGVFQRLHHSEEFEGTGIGLANVRRIIHRHGGRTWAEGSPNNGATFYFSLPNHR